MAVLLLVYYCLHWREEGVPLLSDTDGFFIPLSFNRPLNHGMRFWTSSTVLSFAITTGVCASARVEVDITSPTDSGHRDITPFHRLAWLRLTMVTLCRSGSRRVRPNCQVASNVNSIKIQMVSFLSRLILVYIMPSWVLGRVVREERRGCRSCKY